MAKIGDLKENISTVGSTVGGFMFPDQTMEKMGRDEFFCVRIYQYMKGYKLCLKMAEGFGLTGSDIRWHPTGDFGVITWLK